MVSPSQKADPLTALNDRARRAAGDVERLPADVRGLIGAEEGDDVRDIFGATEAPQRDVLGEALLHILHRDAYALGGLLGHLRLDPTGSHRVNVDVEPPKLQRERPRHGLQTSLGRGVVELPLVAQGDDGGGHDDLAILLLDHVLLNGLGTQKATLEVDVQDLIPVVLAHLKEQVVSQQSCVVDQDVDPTEVVVHLLERRPDLLGTRHVARDREPLAPGILDGHHRILPRLRGEIQDGNVGTLLRQLYSLRRPDAPAGSGYDRYPSIELAHAPSPFSPNASGLYQDRLFLRLLNFDNPRLYPNRTYVYNADKAFVC